MIDLIIFSKDRPMQLSALLSSIDEYCDIFRRILVVTPNDDIDISAYETHYTLRESDYVNGFEGAIKEAIGVCQSPYICFMVDDIICYRKMGKLILSEDSQYSLRLSDARFPYCEWHMKDYQANKLDYNYPFSVDGHIYPTQCIKDIFLADDAHFINPNKFEVHGYSNRERLPKIMCADRQCLVSIPANRVSDTATADFGTQHPYPVEELQTLYDEGKRIDYNAMDFSKVTTAHQELELKFK